MNLPRPLLKSFAILMIVFALGAIIGARVTVHRVKHTIQQARQIGEPHAAIEKAFLRLEKQFTEQLDLNPIESEEVREELMLTAQNLVQIRNQTIMEVDKEIRAALERIGNQLPEDKRPLLREIAEERLSRCGLMTSPSQE